MVFPQGGDFSRIVQSAFKVLKSDKRVCAFDNGTTICEAGHKLKYPGTCFNQSTGTFNSSDASFQPTFPVCTEDYTSSGFNEGVIVSSPEVSSEHPLFEITGGVSSSLYLTELSSVIQSVYNVYKTSYSKQSSSFISQVIDGVSTTFFQQAVPSEVISFWKYGQFNSGALPRLPWTYSDLYVFDVVSSYTFYNKLVIQMLEFTTSKLKQASVKYGYKNLVDTDYYTTISGSVDICEGDEEPPFITYHDPVASGIKLRPRNQDISFSLSDAVGGVDLSSVYVDIESTTSGTYSIVAAGVDQTGGLVSVEGTSDSYKFTYSPGFLWDYNDLVTVTISGSDLPPMVGGDPFYCGAAKVNTFIGDVKFKVLNEEDFSASITALPDTAPPYISYTSPISGSLGNSVLDPLRFGVADDLTGVDLSSLQVYVNSEKIVGDGVPSSSETVISGSRSEYHVTYLPAAGFTYGSDVVVDVEAQDLAQNSPNVLSTSYNLSYIIDSTLSIGNLKPPVGTSVNLADVDISVDITDNTYGVSLPQTYLKVNGTVVSGTSTVLASGVRLSYHPPNDFAYDRPINVLVHAVNGNVTAPVVKDELYTLFYGMRVYYPNEDKFRHADRVDVYLRARNNFEVYNHLSSGYFFTSYTQPSSDLGASIQGIVPWEDLSASLSVVGPEHHYGRLVTVEFYVRDYNGHELGPYTFSYTVEDKP